MTQLVDKGKVTRGYLGVLIQDVDDELAKTFELPHTKGALVTKILPDSPAAKSKLKEEDFIVAINGKPVDSKDALRLRVADLPPGEKVDFTVQRKGKKITVTVKLGTQPENLAVGERRPDEKAKPARYGLEVATLTKDLARRYRYDEDTAGVLITSVESGSDAEEKGLRAGLVIDQVNGKAIGDSEAFGRALGKPGKQADLRLRVTSPDGGRRYLVIAPK